MVIYCAYNTQALHHHCRAPMRRTELFTSRHGYTWISSRANLVRPTLPITAKKAMASGKMDTTVAASHGDTVPMVETAVEGSVGSDSTDGAVGVAATEVDWKTIARRERKRQQRQELLRSMTLEERKAFIHSEDHEKTDQLQRLQRVHADGSGHVKLALDLRYDSIMNEKELKSLGKQLKFVYGSVKMMREPFQLRFFHCSEQLRESLGRFSADRWLVHWHDDEELTDIMPAEDIVYLSPDSPNVLTSLDTTKMYVIGGIVDKSRKKGATLHTAESAGITTARLPIQEHITERLDHILNVNTVADVLIHFHQHGDWKRALTEALPQRKQHSVGRRSKKRQELRSSVPSPDADVEERDSPSDNERESGSAPASRLPLVIAAVALLVSALLVRKRK